jgi:hypothetical protein
MDVVIKSLKKFSLDQNENDFENSLDQVISKMKDLDTNLSSLEWDTLKSNFSKLRYLDYLVSKNQMKLPEKFNESLEIFLKTMDTYTQHYLANIDFEMDSYPSDILEDTKKIKELFEKSLNCNKSILKMKYILGAYILLVPIVEGYTNDPFKDYIDDREFLDNFSFKRQKTK